MSSSLLSKFHALRSSLNAAFYEREDIVNGILVSILSRENMLIYGKAGAAKSELIEFTSKAFKANYFKTLLGKFSTPEQLFGPVSPKALMEKDESRRNTSRYLPWAQFAFVDEVYKGNNAILNTMLGVMNEREFTNGPDVEACPLISMFGASNELPTTDDLAPLHDRFMLRFEARYIRNQEKRIALLTQKRPSDTGVNIEMAELFAAQAEVDQVSLSVEVAVIINNIVEELNNAGIDVSDRRFRKCVRLLQASAWLNGDTSISREDLMILADCFWKQPQDISKVAEIVSKHSQSTKLQLNTILLSAHEDLKAFNVEVANTPINTEGKARMARILDRFRQQQAEVDSMVTTASARNIEAVKQAQEEINAMVALVNQMMLRAINPTAAKLTKG